jgi:hypothetical protein
MGTSLYIVLNTVDFPAPVGPIRKISSPLGIWKVRLKIPIFSE